MMKSLTWLKSWPVEEALLWTEAKAAEPVDGARAGLRVWKILPLCLIFSMIVVILVVFEKMATKPLEWGDHVVAIFYDDGVDGWLTSAVNSKSLSTNICGSLFTHWKANITGFLVIGMLQDGILIKLQVLEDIYCRTSFRLLDTLRWGWVGKGALSKTKLNFWLKILSIIALWTQILFSRSGFSSQWWRWRWCNTYWSGQRQALWR